MKLRTKLIGIGAAVTTSVGAAIAVNIIQGKAEKAKTESVSTEEKENIVKKSKFKTNIAKAVGLVSMAVTAGFLVCDADENEIVTENENENETQYEYDVNEDEALKEYYKEQGIIESEDNENETVDVGNGKLKEFYTDEDFAGCEVIETDIYDNEQ